MTDASGETGSDGSAADLPVFSVVTCCYNQGAFLGECIRAVLDQDYPRFEHIVVDDGSTDDTAEVCRRFEHVNYIYQPNAGQSAALNRGFKEATGDVIAWVNSDDYHESGAFGRVAEAFASLPPRTFIGGEANVVNAEGTFMWKLKNGPVPFYRLLWHPVLYKAEGRCAIPCQPSVFFPRGVVDDIGYLDTDLKYGMDYEYWLRALTRGYRFEHVSQVFSNYRYHATSHTVQGYDTFLPEWTEVSHRYMARLSTAGRAAAGAWRAYLAIESVLFRRHKRGMATLDELRASDRDAMPWGAQARALGRAACQAPWLLFNVARHVATSRLGAGLDI